ncbi:hypothetical protein ACFUJR_19465 [Streptomyces sp. NPDC057271]|uniref:DIP1984 family protein n=1 Tax=unclassified Streptomyces TaxID=2593676 RepID=UPI0036416338
MDGASPGGSGERPGGVAAKPSALEASIRRINRTDATVEMGPDGTLTGPLARGDVLRLRHSVVTAGAEAAAGSDERGYGRQLRSELMMLSAPPGAELRGQADARRSSAPRTGSGAHRTAHHHTQIRGGKGGFGAFHVAAP